MAEKRISRTRVKICGTTCLEDALAAVSFGADALGFIYYHKSPRYIDTRKAAEIIRKLPPLVDRVGVFVNAELDELLACAGTGLSYLQLHGNESPDYCRELRLRLPGCGIIKAFRVGDESLAEEFSPYTGCVDGFLLDTYVPGAKGGTGKQFDWSIIERLELQRPVILAGGLSPENISRAISSVRPYAVDINSGIESEPGKKDHDLLKKIMGLVAQTALL